MCVSEWVYVIVLRYMRRMPGLENLCILSVLFSVKLYVKLSMELFFFSRILLILVIQTSFPSFFFVLLITDLVSRLQLQCRFKTFLFFLLFACAQYTLKLPIQNIVFVRHHARIAAGFRMYVECCGREISTPTENWLIFIFYHHKHTRTQNIEAKRDKELWGLWQVRDGDGGVVDARV